MSRMLSPCMCLVLTLSAAATHAVETAGTVTAVTVYQGQALVTREVSLEAAEGLAEVVVTGLPARVMPGSLYAEPVGDLEVRSVRYRVRPVAEDTRDEVRELDAKLQVVGDELAAVEAKQKLLDERSRYLQKLEDFTTKTASAELTRGVLNAGTLSELTRTIFEGRAEIAEQQLTLNKEKRELTTSKSLATKARQQLTNSSSKTVREAVVFVDAGAGGAAASFRLTYLVSGASWSPSYNLRASEDRDQVMVEYNASVTQQSGEDWGEVAMTLSTASPSLVASAPELEPLPVRLAAVVSKPKGGTEIAVLGDQLRSLARQQQQLAAGRRGSGVVAGAMINDADGEGASSRSGPTPFFALSDLQQRSAGGFGAAYNLGAFGVNVADADKRLNAFGNRMELMCFNSTVTCPTVPTKPSSAQGISVVYRLAGRTSLPSRSDQQLIAIASLPLDGEFYRLAKPVLTEYVYEEASVVNDTDFVLLAGPAATFLGDRFVGRGAVPTVAIGEPFAVGLGIDESLRATRELVDQDRRVQGGNQVVEVNYRLRLENFGDADKQVRLYDRLPSADNDQIKVMWTTDKFASTNAATEDEQNRGILRWDLPVQARGESAGTADLKYQVVLEYDRNRTLEQATATR
ncbi:MAG: mucoidy inhibitor MuiA family protein [Planctomycetota bacterium]